MGKFLSSNFSGYLALIQLGLIVVAIIAVYAYGYGECKEAQAVKDGKAAQAQVSHEVAISKELHELNKEVDNDESDDLSIIRNAIGRL
jgi:hypothetical protein